MGLTPDCHHMSVFPQVGAFTIVLRNCHLRERTQASGCVLTWHSLRLNAVTVAVLNVTHALSLADIFAAAQDAVHDKMLNTSRVLKHDPAQPGRLLPAEASSTEAARSAPQETSDRARQLERRSSSHGASPSATERQHGRKHDESGVSHPCNQCAKRPMALSRPHAVLTLHAGQV